MWDVYLITIVNRLIVAMYNRGEELTTHMEEDYVVVDSEPAEMWPGEFVDGLAEIAEEVTNGEGDFRSREEEAGDTLPTDMSDTSESEPEKPTNNGVEDKCTASHEGKLFLRQEFPINVDQLFTMIFTNSRFNLELLAARGTADYVQTPWQPKNGLKCREVSYKLSLSSGPMGPKEVHVTELQVMNKCSRPGSLYSIDSTSENAGIPYADYFSVQAHYCLRRDRDKTAMELYGHIKYKKTMWPLVKAFLEKSAMGGLEEFARLLESRLISTVRPPRASLPAPAHRSHRRRRRHDVLPLSPVTAASAVLPAAVAAQRAGAAGRGGAWLALALLLLLALNALLCWQLYHAGASRGVDLDHLHNRMSSLSEAQAAQWARSLERHSHRQRGQLLAWRAALDRIVHHLVQTEQALEKLLDIIKPALEKTQDAEREEL